MAGAIKSYRLQITGQTELWKSPGVCGRSSRSTSLRILWNRYSTLVFLCGRALDVDGVCGGYNLQWAWSSGSAAGRAAAGEHA